MTLDGDGVNSSLCSVQRSRNFTPTTGAKRSTTAKIRKPFGVDSRYCSNRQAPFSVRSPPVSLQRFSTEKLLSYEPLLPQLVSQQSMYVTFHRLTPSGRLSELKTLQRHYAERRASSVNLTLPQRGWSSNALTSCLQSSLL